MSKQFFTEGQEAASADFNNISDRLEKQFYEDILYYMLDQRQNAFFRDSLRVTYNNNSSVNIKAGLGLQRVVALAGSNLRPMILRNNTTLAIQPPSPNPRIDIVQIRSRQIDGESASRRFKPADPLASIVTRNTVLEKLWGSEINIKTGIPAAVPVAPAADDGFLKIAELAVTNITGIVDADAITDTRDIYSIAQVPTQSGIHLYDKVVGDKIGGGITHLTLLNALDDSQEGDHILVLTNQISQRSGTNEIPSIVKNNITIEFKQGVYVRAGDFGAHERIGIQVLGDDAVIKNPTLANFEGGALPDAGIGIIAGVNRTIIENLKFYNCEHAVRDDSNEAYINVAFELTHDPTR